MHYLEADRILHVLSQYIARATRAFVEPKADDSHTNLTYDALGDRLLGRWIQAGENAFLPGLRLTDQALVWYDDQHADLLVVPTVGRLLSEITSDFERLLPEIGLAAEPFVAPLHYELPEYDFLDDPVALIPDETMIAWRSYRSHANMTCQLLLSHLEVGGEVRIWPHHFDSGIYVQINKRLGLGFGLATADAESEFPYYYVAGYTKTGPVDYSEAPELDFGAWRNGSFKGGILTGERAPAPQAMDSFIRQTVSWLVQQG